jgi:hypothetical protein
LARAEIFAGICGFSTVVEASTEGDGVTLSITSDCEAVQGLAKELVQIDPYQQISFRRGTPRILEMGAKHCIHAACPVPVGIVKAVEVEAGLALPADATIKLSKTQK